MYGPVLLSLLLALMAVDTAGARAPSAAWTLLATVGVLVGVFVAGLALGGLVMLRERLLAVDEQRFLRHVGRLSRIYRLLGVGAFAYILYVLEWRALAVHWAGSHAWALPAFLLAFLPMLVIWLVSWVALYWADRRMRAALWLRAGALTTPPQWTLPRYVAFMFRQYVLVLLGPIILLIGAQDVIVHLWGEPDSAPLAAVAMFGLLLAAGMLAGPWLRLCWRTEPLPTGPLRGRLEALGHRARIGIREILVWRSNLTIANGCMVGLVGPLRYILITDALMLSLSEAQTEAVFAHEVAHARHHHVLYYLLLGAGGASGALLVGMVLAAISPWSWLVSLAVPGTILIFWWFGFGAVSRRCELQSDLYACRATSCPVGCSPPNAGRSALVPTEGGLAVGGLCEHRVGVFISALRTIARLNGSAETQGGWRHFSVARRRAFLERMLARPGEVWRFERRMAALRTVTGLLALFLVTAALTVLSLATVLGPEDIEHPGRPEDVPPDVERWIVRLVDRDQVHALAGFAPELHREADPPAELHDGRPAGAGRQVAAAEDDVAVADARAHAVAVNAERHSPRQGLVGVRHVHELADTLGRRFRELHEGRRVQRCRVGLAFRVCR